MGRGTAAVHKKVDPIDRDPGMPLLQADMCSMNTDGTYYEAGEAIVPENLFSSRMILVDGGTGASSC